MTNNSYNHPPIQTQDYISTSTSNLSKPQLDAEKQKHWEYRERLLLLYMEHIHRTGEVNYPPLKKLLRKHTTPSNGFQEKQQAIINLALAMEQDNQERSEMANNTPVLEKDRQVNHTEVFEKTKQEIVNTTLAIKDNLKNIVETCRPVSTGQSIRYLIEEISQSSENIPFATALKSEHLKLAKYIDRLLDLAKKYRDKELTTSGRSIAKLTGDLTYFRLYIEHHAQVTRIQQEIYLVNDPAIYLYRLHQYLDLLPETAIALINMLQNALESDRSKA